MSINEILLLSSLACAAIAGACFWHSHVVERPSRRVIAFGVSQTASALAIASAISFTAITSGCGDAPQQTARHFVDGAGEGLDITDRVFAEQYTVRARAALDATQSMDEYRAAVATIDAVARGLEVAHHAIELGDAAVRVWEQNGAADWPHAEACIIGALVGVRDLLVAAGVPVPPELAALLDGVRATIDADQCFAEAPSGS